MRFSRRKKAVSRQGFMNEIFKSESSKMYMEIN